VFLPNETRWVFNPPAAMKMWRERKTGAEWRCWRRRAVLPSFVRQQVGVLIAGFRSSVARPTDTLVYASTDTSRCPP
jgi:hypothetical protein